jgi:hypothetical protein
MENFKAEWTSYDANGNKVAIGSYNKGQKFFEQLVLAKLITLTTASHQ